MKLVEARHKTGLSMEAVARAADMSLTGVLADRTGRNLPTALRDGNPGVSRVGRGPGGRG